MEKLTNREEEILQILWDKGEAFIKDIIPEMQDELHYNTVSTLVRLMVDKGFVGNEPVGNSHKYFPILKKEDYKKSFVPQVIKKYFDNSYKSMVTYFAEEEKLSAKDLREILEIIEKNEPS